MVIVIVGEDDFAHVAEVEFQITHVGEDGFGARTGVDEDAMAVGFDQRGKSPFPDPLVGKHGGEDGDFEVLNLRMRFSGARGLCRECERSQNH